MPRFLYYSLPSSPKTDGEAQPTWGLVRGDTVVPLRAGPLAPEPEPAGDPLPLGAVRFHPPGRPTKIICVGRNYAAHAAELANDLPPEPLIFLKPPSCLIARGEPIQLPLDQSELVHHEGELAIVIGRRARRVPRADALAHVLGYTIMNDVTARDVQRRDKRFTRAKGYDTFGPLGPWIDTDFEPGAQRLTVHVGGELRQEGTLDQMIFQAPELIAHISAIMTLEPGDVISTGTPAGVGPLLPGDQVSVRIAGLGVLENPVEAAP